MWDENRKRLDRDKMEALCPGISAQELIAIPALRYGRRHDDGCARRHTIVDSVEDDRLRKPLETTSAQAPDASTPLPSPAVVGLSPPPPPPFHANRGGGPRRHRAQPRRPPTDSSVENKDRRKQHPSSCSRPDCSPFLPCHPGQPALLRSVVSPPPPPSHADDADDVSCALSRLSMADGQPAPPIRMPPPPPPLPANDADQPAPPTTIPLPPPPFHVNRRHATPRRRPPRRPSTRTTLTTCPPAAPTTPTASCPSGAEATDDAAAAAMHSSK